MIERAVIIVILIAATAGSFWLLNRVLEKESDIDMVAYHDPDYYLEDFTTLTMEQNGKPKNKLYAVYMAHYPDDDTSELLKPKMEIYRENKTPLYITADKGWVTADNDVILLHGNVQFWENNEQGLRIRQVDTSEVRILLNDEYAETDQFTTITSSRTTIIGTGMRAYFNESRLEVLAHEKTRIEQRPNI